MYLQAKNRMPFKKEYIVSTDDVNSHGFVTLTSGIDIESAAENCPAYIDHKYWELPIGHWTNLRKEGSLLKATLIIDGANDREREVIRKIENGDLRGSSIGVDAITWSEDPVYLKQGQTKPTLTQSDLFEISVTALPSNKAALCLKKEAMPVLLSAGNIHDIVPSLKPNTDMEKIALALGLTKDATEAQILTAIQEYKLTGETAATLSRELLDMAADGLGENEKNIFITLSKTNVKQALEYAESIKAIENRQPEKPAVEKDVKVSDIIKMGKNSQEPNVEGKDSFDYLSKHNVAELNRIRLEDPEKYAKLCREYQQGVRYTAKTA